MEGSDGQWLFKEKMEGSDGHWLFKEKMEGSDGHGLFKLLNLKKSTKQSQKLTNFLIVLSKSHFN